MSAPVTERGRTAVRSRTAAIPAQRGFPHGAADGAVAAPVAPTSDPRAEVRRSAQQKAYARRDERARRGAGVRPARTAAAAGRPQFVLLIMVLLAVGLVATLWLSTAAAADSYRLQDATAAARVLSEQAERLKQDVAVLGSAPELARRAGELGMISVRDPARLVVAPDGSVEVVGQPRAAVPPPPPPPPAPPVGTQPPAGSPDGVTPGTTTPGGAVPDGAAQLAAPDAEEAGAAAVDGDTPGESGEDTPGQAGQDTAAQDTAAQGAAGQGARPGTGTHTGGGTDAG
jgi:hypothetical protein